MNYSQAINFITSRRRDELIAAEVDYMSALNQYPELKKADDDYRSAILLTVMSDDDTEEKRCKTRLRGIIEKLGLQNLLPPAPHCAKCGDTGFCDGKICDCVKAMAIGDKHMALALHDFADIDYSMFPDGERAIYENIADKYARFFTGKFPGGNIKTFSLLGKAGTGKTYLASCAVKTAIERGYSAVFVTAFTFVSDMTKYHTTFNDSREGFLSPYIDCDLLAIDDLGTEPINKNVTLEYLYLVLNERQLAGKHTIITSNLTMNEIGVRYGERITSRLFDNKTCNTHEFNGSDIRSVVGKLK